MDAPVDLLVIGGGIHGACVARDAARRGLSVVLCEKDDLASGTSSRSSKLVHGGLRYLETGQFALVREALAERAILLRTAPHLVRPLPFLLPIERDAPNARPAWMLRVGLSLYDRLAARAGADAAAALPRHRLLTRDEALALEPGLPAARLAGAALYYDAQMDDARLVIANAVDAAAHGAVIRTRCAITEFLGQGNGWSMRTRDGEEIRARQAVNAAGPWVDEVRRREAIRGAGAGAGPTIRPTRGTHIVVPALTRERALLLFAADRRVFFVLPYGTRSLVGTTDVDDSGDPDRVHATADDVSYLRAEIERRWPGHGGPPLRAFAGLRPLAVAPQEAAGGGVAFRLPWRSPREARIVDDDGLLSMTGGKYTTARALAGRVVDLVVARLDATGRTRPCDTATAPLPARPDEPARAAVGAEPIPPGEADVAYAVHHEFARGVGDMVWRRSALWLDRAAARAAAPTIAARMAPLLGWSDVQRDAEARAVQDACDEEERWLDEP